MIKALGKHPEDEVEDNTAQLSRYLNGQVCLLFSKLDPASLNKELATFEVEDYAQAGAKATYTVLLAKGKEALDGYGHSMEV